MPTYIITSHIEFPSKVQPIKTGTIRMEIPAASEDEAKIKAMAFITGKTKVVIESCENKDRKETTEAELKRVMEQFGNLFG
ncbi:RAD52 family DNA repair protein [Hymenobacter mucosus]|uniref:Uncharacterized protein n=1 Tax=Hymenobacter mucosus TaxID=1411120 RepID=A0A239A984_9BACT|nr:hypothetical protein [Hymenobacter mucosus]SNR91901.1 hypothetical protein SAMN06269173_11160 [Hymenobacter mucosus]